MNKIRIKGLTNLLEDCLDYIPDYIDGRNDEIIDRIETYIERLKEELNKTTKCKE